ncbi:MAG TPA: tetratricopeptide repeat protein, partial [Pirellulaceae bacterium]|nr:tetratricopeptide repeat protein [Pirellulaceae bacterium]
MFTPLRAPLWTVVCLTVLHTGCAMLPGQQASTRTTANPATASPSSRIAPASGATSDGGLTGGVRNAGGVSGDGQMTVSRVAYIEDKYRDEYDPIQKKKASGFDALSADNLKANFKQWTGRGPNPAIARTLFAEAEDLYTEALASRDDARQAKFAAAGAKYAEAAARWPDSLLEEDALFMSGQAYFFADQYPNANTQYELLVKKHPNTRHMDQIDGHRFAIAQYWLELNKVSPQHFYSVNLTDNRRPWRDTRGHAFRVFDRIRIDDPTGKLSDDATLAAANAYFASGDYFRADALYTDLRKAFPSSEHQFTAHFLGLKTKLLCYEGPDYSGDALDQAEQLIKQIRRQFPQQADAERDYLTRAFKEVRFKKAERIWTMGRYHELRHEYRAAE